MKTCCGSSVGILIQDHAGRHLMITRSWWPVGVAPIAGHALDGPLVWEAAGLDIDATFRDAAIREVHEEAGLTVTDLRQVYHGHRRNLCASLPHQPPGHEWRIYRAQVTGTLRPSPDETKGAAWYTRDQIEFLARRTVEHAYGKISRPEFEQNPGLEAVWAGFFHELGIIQLTTDELAVIHDLAGERPPAYWPSGPPTVVLCGSTRFPHAFRKATIAETLAGKIVLSIGVDLRTDLPHASPGEVAEIKTRLDALHKQKIDLADEVLIVSDESGYYGESTRSEISYARSLGKPVRFLDPAAGEAR